LSPTHSASTATAARVPGKQDETTLTLTFEDNRHLHSLFGEHDEHLALIEHRLNVELTPRGNRLSVKGAAAATETTRQVLLALYDRAMQGHDVTRGEVDGAIRMAKIRDESDHAGTAQIRTRRKQVMPRTPMQKAYIEAIRKNELVFGIGPAGTGKTYLAVACAAEALMNGELWKQASGWDFCLAT
jgi:phosphate starvation-inducible protein PhoH and related proteins